MAFAELPALGVGIIYSLAIEPLLERHPELFPVLEVEPQTTWIKVPGVAEPYRVNREMLDHLSRLPGRKIIHSVGTPVGGTVRPEPAQLERLQETIDYFGSPWASDHLSFNQTSEFATGFFLPPRQTLQGVGIAIASIRALQAALPVPIAVETGVSYLRPLPDELSDGDFVGRVVEGADCGLLLDLHNVYCNSVNGRQPLDEYLQQVPLDRVWEIHLAGGMERDGFWLDAHSGAIPDSLYAVAEKLIPRLPNLKAIIFEIFPSFVPVIGLELVREQIERLHALWNLRTSNCERPPVPVRLQLKPETSQSASPAVWECALGRLVIGRRADDELGRQFERDPGVRIVEELIHEFRASMIVGVLRLTSRLLMLALGPAAFRTILSDYWSKTPPQMYASVEAEAFACYLEALALKVPHLGEVLLFERAATATLIDGQARIVRFDLEPLPLLRALAEGRLPTEPGQPGDYEIEITPDGLADNASLEGVQQSVPFH
ncbi:MAG TPA: DUF692 family multinuclear iron-containing protein [Candidatus Binatia bacterium]